MGFDKRWGIKSTWDEAGYTAYPLFKESGMEPPMIWEVRKGEPSQPVVPLDLNMRPIVDLTSDPHEDWNLFDTKLTQSWVFAPAFRLIQGHIRASRNTPTFNPAKISGATAQSIKNGANIGVQRSD